MLKKYLYPAGLPAGPSYQRGPYVELSDIELFLDTQESTLHHSPCGDMQWCLVFRGLHVDPENQTHGSPLLCLHSREGSIRSSSVTGIHLLEYI